MATIMVQGTSSDAGKSTLVAGLCRLLAKRGVKVAPFKPQNMALNSAVTADGGEIGRAQALQAQACFLPPHTDMNPILLKPSSDVGAQVIVHGKAVTNLNAVEYHDYKQVAMQAVLHSHQRLDAQYDMVMVEGAGSPAEINLRTNDIANMGFAEAVDCPVIIVADIDRGGVFAQLVGTLALLSESEQQRVVGFVINRFRGDIALLESGLDWLEQKTGKPVLGVLPYLHGLYVDAEDAIDSQQELDITQQIINVVVPVFSRISNHTDFDPLRLHPQVNLQFVGKDQIIPSADLIILPGSKNVRADVDWLRDNGWEQAITKHLRYGGKVLGICGGYQMLGTVIADPLGIEQTAGESLGLGLLDIQTVLAEQKELRQVQGNYLATGKPVIGYEIHCGQTSGVGLQQPVLTLTGVGNEGAVFEGAVSADKQVMGTYLHGLFDSPEVCADLLAWVGLADAELVDSHARCEQDINRLAQAIEDNIDIDVLLKLCAKAA